MKSYAFVHIKRTLSQLLAIVLSKIQMINKFQINREDLASAMNYGQGSETCAPKQGRIKSFSRTTANCQFPSRGSKTSDGSEKSHRVK